ncbi:hypothetical protein AC578_6637 [Pseudocercospora eumusae]|uniref:Uncharacterized protein n=1 Tax=Pseudocercospora eumusae TaxID=321146 RepID=A0A139HG07_9PEZI|nr:hypothetical protein AC578_6637 [Pseudocercospora eumusae]
MVRAPPKQSWPSLFEFTFCVTTCRGLTTSHLVSPSMRIRKAQKLKRLMKAGPTPVVKPPSRPSPKRKTQRDTPQKHSFTASLAIRSKPSNSPAPPAPPASQFAEEECISVRERIARTTNDAETAVGKADSSSVADTKQSERDGEVAAHFSALGLEELPRDRLPRRPGTLYNGEIHHGYRRKKAKQLVKIERIMEPLRASEVLHSRLQPRDSSGNLKDPMEWDVDLLKTLRQIVELSQDVNAINDLLTKAARLRYGRGDQKHKRVGYGAAMDVLMELQHPQLFEREEAE